MTKTEWFGKRYTYAELCELFGEERTRGGYQRKQLKRWNENYLINKVGRYYDLIKERTEEEKEEYILSNRTCSSLRTLEKTGKDVVDMYKSGVYMIKSKETNDVYIGSTKQQFMRRYTAHKSSYNPCSSKDIIDKPHEFIPLLIEDDIDKNLLRRIESAYITYYDLYTDYNVININNPSPKKAMTPKMKKLKILEEYYEEVINFCKERGIKYE